MTGFFSLTQVPQVNFLEPKGFEDVLSNLSHRSQPLNSNQEAPNYEAIRRTILWRNRRPPDQSSKLPSASWKNRKQPPSSWRSCSLNSHPRRLRKSEVQTSLFSKRIRARSSLPSTGFKTAGHFSIAKTVEEIRKRSRFPNFMDFLYSTIKKRLTCLQPKRAPSKNEKTPCNQFHPKLFILAKHFEVTWLDRQNHQFTFKCWQLLMF